MAKNKKVRHKKSVGKKEAATQERKIDPTFIIAILLGLVLTVSAGTILFVSFGYSDMTLTVAGNHEKGLMITPLGFDLALLLIVMVSAIIIIFSTKDKGKIR